MKISFRILLINFVTVAVILISSAFAFYSITYKVFSTQQSKYLSNSKEDFINSFRTINENIDNDFTLFLEKKDHSGGNLGLAKKTTNIDFIFIKDNSSASLETEFTRDFIELPKGKFSLYQFLQLNPAVIVHSYKTNNNIIYYYGKRIDENTLNKISDKIGSDIAIVSKGIPLEVSNNQTNQEYTYNLVQAINTLSNNKGNIDVNTQEAENSDIISTLYTPTALNESNQLDFLIFSNLFAVADMRFKIKIFLIVIGVAGILLSLILTLVFTDKIRKQIGLLSKATENTKQLDFKNKINIKSKDELGKLALAFNNMLDVLNKNQKMRSEYAEFIALLNQNPSLNEISDAALKKIIRTYDFAAGALYSVEDETTISLLSSYGIKSQPLANESSSYFDLVLKEKKQIEFNLENNPAEIKTGTIIIKIKYLLIVPIIYNGKIISVLELCAADKPTDEAREYLVSIQEQMAIGLMNAKTFVKMENLVEKLKQLNESYQQQNYSLMTLHKELKTKADELFIQKQKAEESTKLKSQFLASMSHELRTPMNSILGLTELMLSDQTISDKSQERLGVVLKSGKRLMQLINDILDLSKIEAGKMTMAEDNIVLDDLLKEVETSIKPLANDKDLDFIVTKEMDSRVIIQTDKNKITQILLNLLGNAVKFTHKGKVELRVNQSDREKLRFDIIDTGIGIPKSEQQSIFEEFRQIDGTISRKYSGTGLGLSISKKIVNLLNGELLIKSELNVGSVFTFIIPVKYIEFSHEPFADTKTPVVQTIDTNTEVEEKPEASKKILIVDDDPDILFTLKEIVQSLDYKGEIANGGKECLAMLEIEKPDLILLDIMMPDMNGFQTIKKIRESEKFKDIPVLAVSAKAMSSEKDIILKHGFDDFIPKPVDAKILNYKIQKFLHNLEVHT